MATSIYEFAKLSQLAHAQSGGARRQRARNDGATPTIGVIYNPRSHRNKGQDLDCGLSPDIFVAQPGNRSQLPRALSRLAERGIDLLVINGGDGTVRDVLTCGYGIFGDDWPAIAVLPKGKTNALAVDLEAPGDWSLQGAVDAFQSGRRIVRRPMAITPLDQSGSTILGFILGAGAFTLGTQAGQSAHRLGAFNSLAVGVTTGWGVIQSIFGSRKNPWRRGVETDIRVGSKRAPLAHSGLGDPTHRQFLLASTLERFPAGLKPFGSLREGLKLAVLDQVSRTMTVRLPAIMLGWSPKNPRERGVHQVSASSFEMTIGGQFILDGEAFPAGQYRVETGPELEFVAP